MHSVQETNSVRLTALEHQVGELLRETSEIKSKLDDFNELKTGLSSLVRSLALSADDNNLSSMNLVKNVCYT